MWNVARASSYVRVMGTFDNSRLRPGIARRKFKNVGFQSIHDVVDVNRDGVAVSVTVFDFCTYAWCVLYLKISSAGLATGNAVSAGSCPVLIISLVHCMKALMLYLTDGFNLICPFATVNTDYDFKSSSNSSIVLSIHVWKSSSKTSIASLCAWVALLNRITLSTLHAILASVTVIGAANFFTLCYNLCAYVKYHKNWLDSSLQFVHCQDDQSKRYE